MPNVDGLSLLKQLRSRIPEGEFVPTLILTADNSRTVRQEALSAGAKDFLSQAVGRRGNGIANLQSAGDTLASRRIKALQRNAGGTD